MALSPEELAKQQLEMRRIEEYAKSIGLSFEQIAKLQEKILKNSGKTAESLKAEAKTIADSRKEFEKYEARLAKVQIDTDDMAKALLSTSKSQIKANRDALDELYKQAEAAKNTGALLQEELDATEALVKARRDLLTDLETLNQKAPYLAETFKAVSEAGKEMQSSIDGIFKNIPGGGFLKKALGLDDVENQINQGLNDAMNAFIDKKGDAGEAFKAFTRGVNMGALAVAGVVFAAKGLYDLMDKLNKEAKAYATETGLSVGQAGALVQKSYELQASSANELATREDILAVQKDVAKEFAGIVQLSDATVLSLANMSAGLAYSSEQAGAVQSALMSLGGTEQASLEAQKLAANLADAAGVAPGEVMEDIAKNAKLSSKYFGNNVKAIAKAAAEGKKLGLSLDQMVKISDSLLDIESSLSNQFEYMALTGKEVNFDLARQLALQGDIAGAAESIINEMGGLPDDPLALQAAADAAGLSVEELQKVYATSANINGLTDDEKANRKEAAAEAAKMAERQKEMAAQLEKIASIFTSALLPVVKGFGYIIEFIAGSVNAILDGFDLLLNKLGPVSVGLKVILAIIGAIAALAIITAAAISVGSIPVVGYSLMAAVVMGMLGLLGRAMGVIGTGDLSMGAMKNGGPIVANPREGTIFQGTRNDEVAMGPGVINAAQASTGASSTTNVSVDTSKLENLMETLITKIDDIANRTANIIINDRVVDEIKMSADIISTYKVGRR